MGRRFGIEASGSQQDEEGMTRAQARAYFGAVFADYEENRQATMVEQTQPDDHEYRVDSGMQTGRKIDQQ